MPAFDDVLSTLALIMGGPLTITIFYFCKDRTPNDHFPSDDARHDDLKAGRLPSNLGRQARNIAAVQLPRQASIVFTYTVTTSPECVICLEEFREGQECRLLAICNHSYHKSCVDQWLAVTESNCPLCRALGEARYWSMKLYSRETSCTSKELFSQYIWVLSGKPKKVSGSYE